eukprot:gene2758-3011_t
MNDFRQAGRLPLVCMARQFGRRMLCCGMAPLLSFLKEVAVAMFFHFLGELLNSCNKKPLKTCVAYSFTVKQRMSIDVSIGMLTAIETNIYYDDDLLSAISAGWNYGGFHGNGVDFIRRLPCAAYLFTGIDAVGTCANDR